jgi:CelD/BcsL family acetyltransferase involved in cellulose biosynthesis
MEFESFPDIALQEPTILAGISPAGTTAGATSPALTVVRITEESALDAIRDEWNELLQSSRADSLFLTWEWAATWWKYLGAPGRLIVFAVRHRGELVALAPFRLRPSRLLRKQPFPVLEFLGSGFAGSDYLDVIARQGYEAEAVDALARECSSYRRVRSSWFKWSNLIPESCLAARLAARLNARGWSLDETQTNICPYIPLEGHTWESYLASLGTEHRADFRRKWNRLNRDFDIRFEAAQSADECAESIDLLIEQHNLRWRHRGGSDAFHTPELVAFHREVSQVALGKGWLRLYVLWLNDKPAASLYGFLYGGKFYFYQSGFDIAYEKYSVGMIAMGLAIQRAIGEGAREYDLLHGDETYKSHWSRHHRSLVRLELYPAGIRGLLYRGSIAVARAAQETARNAFAGPDGSVDKERLVRK